jgi:DnaK suppressor protein
MVPRSTAEIRVLAEQDRLRRELTALSTKRTSSCAADVVDLAEQLAARREVERRTVEVQRRLAAVHHALARCRSGTYEVCAACGGGIDADRLTTQPLTSHCVACARDVEAVGA